MKHVLAGLCVIALAAAGSAQAGLIHRWSFSETGGAGTILADSIGGANATIVDVGANNGTVGGGQVTLAGGAQGSSDYVSLPAGLLSPLANASIETWATQISVQNWSRIFDFGSSTTNNLLMAWTQGTNLGSERVAFKIGGTENYVDNTMQPYTLGQQFHIVMTVDDTGGPSGQTQIRVYKDGVYRGTLNTNYNLSQLVEATNYIGRSQYGDNTANASWNEFRIYNNVLTPFAVRESWVAGPDKPNAGNIALVEARKVDYRPIRLDLVLAPAQVNFDQPLLGGGPQVLGGIPFNIADVGGLNGWNAGNGAGANRFVTIPVNMFGVQEADLLLGTWWGEQVAGTYASLLFLATTGETYTVQLDGNSELRDYQQGSFANSINGITTIAVLTGGIQRVDMTRVVLPDEWSDLTLASITVQDFGASGSGADGFQRVFVTGLTVGAVPEPASLTLLALGILARRRRR